MKKFFWAIMFFLGSTMFSFALGAYTVAHEGGIIGYQPTVSAFLGGGTIALFMTATLLLRKNK